MQSACGFVFHKCNIIHAATYSEINRYCHLENEALTIRATKRKKLISYEYNVECWCGTQKSNKVNMLISQVIQSSLV